MNDRRIVDIRGLASDTRASFADQKGSLRRVLSTRWLFVLITYLVPSIITPAPTAAQVKSAGLPTNSETRVTVVRSTHPLAKGTLDAGAVDGSMAMERMVLVLGASAEQEHELRSFLDRQHTKGTPDYHRWLTPEEFSTRFGPAADDVQQAKAWLQQQGLSVDRVARGGRWIEFSGAAFQVESAFQTQMRHYQVAGVTHTANATDISIPRALSPIVRGVLSLHDFTSRPMLANHYRIQRDSSGAFVPVDPGFTLSESSGTFHFLTPSDYDAIYGISSLYQSGVNGSGQTIAIVSRSNIELADVETFRQIFALPANDPNVIVSGPDPGYVGNDALEASLDVEWAGAIAPRATVDLVVTSSTVTTDGIALSAAYIVDNNLADVVNVSYSLCERNLGTAGSAFYSALWQQAATEGMSVVVAAGDNGAAGCDDANDPTNLPTKAGLAVNGLASTPFNTAVGGTEFAENGNATTFWNAINASGFSSVIGYIPEEVWNESCDPTTSTTCGNNAYSLYAGSGGVSTVYSKPSWQSASGVPADGLRDVPDVSLSAAGHDGYLVCSVGSCLTTPDGNLLEQATVVGGTSAAAPSFAGILALVNQKAGNRQGLANYVLYPLAARDNLSNCNSSARTTPATSTQCVFNDITAGNNSVPGQAGFTAGTGFDLASGLGSVNAANLVNTWSSVTFQASQTGLTVPVTAAVHGQAVPVAVNVGASSGSGVPSGDFVLFSDKYGAVGVGTLSSGVFNGSFASLPGGQYNLTAHYQGDGTFGNSDSLPVAVNIGLENSAISLGSYTYSSSGPTQISSVPYGDFLYLHSAVTSTSGNGIPTGTVTYQDGSTSLGSITLNSKGEGELVSGGFAQLGAAISLSVGSHSITASYSGDNSLNSSTTSQPLILTITRGTAYPSITTSQTTIGATQQLLLHLFIAGSSSNVPPTGTVQFMDGITSLGQPILIPAPVSGVTPQVDFQISLPVGSHVITAMYSGDSNYNAASALNSVPVTVTSAIGSFTQTTLTATFSSPSVGDVVHYKVSVSGSQPTPVPTGTVQLMNGELGTLGSATTLVNGSATVPIQWTFGGDQSLSAQYSGDASHAASASVPISVTVKTATPTITLAANPATANSGTQVSLTATVATLIRPIVGGLVGLSGTVQFFDSLNQGTSQPFGSPVGLILTTVDPSNTAWSGFAAAAVLPVYLKDGNHTITAQYLGNSSYGPVASNAATVSVGSRKSTQTTLRVDSNSPAYGQTLTFSAEVKPGQSSPTLTGTVAFVNSASGTLGSAALQNGVATLAIPWNVGGIQNVIAQYSGDSNYASSRSDPAIITLPSFEFAGNNQLMIPPGTSAAVALSLTPVAGFRSTINLSCGSGIPAGSTCSISASSVALDGVTTAHPNLVLSIAPLPASSNSIPRTRSRLWSQSIALTGLIGVALVLPAGRRKLKLVVLLIFIGVLVSGLSCGGGNSGTGGGGGGGGGNTNPVTSTTALISSASTVPAGSPVTLTARVSSSANAISGNVTFYDGATTIGQSTISNGQAQLTTSSLIVGTHSIVATYSGDSLNMQSTSPALQQGISGSIQFPIIAAGAGQTRTITITVLID